MNKEIKYNDFIFYYNKTDDRITNITNSHTSIQYTISYINDKRGNWIKMTITPSRETYERILYLKKELINTLLIPKYKEIIFYSSKATTV